MHGGSTTMTFHATPPRYVLETSSIACEGFQRLVMNVLRLEIRDVRLGQCDVPLDHVDAPLMAGLRDITRGAIGKGRARMRLSREVALHSSDFNVESFLSLLLGYRADAQAGSNAEISLIDESSAVREDSDACCASCGHELLL
jgi:hypothetical protein